jgi:hypothetical protein
MCPATDRESGPAPNLSLQFCLGQRMLSYTANRITRPYVDEIFTPNISSGGLERPGICADPIRSNRSLLMLKAYIDDSRMNQPPLYSLGGWVAPAEKWAPFSDAWRDILWMKPRIEYFKLDEAMNFNGEFQGISEESRNEKLRLLVGLIEEFDLLGAVSLIPHNIFYPLFGRHPQREIRNPYVLSFFGIIANVAGYMHQAGIEDKIEFVFDYQPTSISQVLEGWELFKQNAPAKFRKFLTEHPLIFWMTNKSLRSRPPISMRAGRAYAMKGSLVPIPSRFGAKIRAQKSRA